MTGMNFIFCKGLSGDLGDAVTGSTPESHGAHSSLVFRRSKSKLFTHLESSIGLERGSEQVGNGNPFMGI